MRSAALSTSSTQIRFEGRVIEKVAPRQVIGRGIARTFQNLGIYGRLSVSDSQKGVPNLFVFSGSYERGDEKTNPWTIALAPSFTTKAAVYADYLTGMRPNAKIGLLYLNTDMGRDFQSGLKAGIAGCELNVVSAQPTANTDPTVDTQMTALRESGADTLMVVAAPRQAAQAVKFAADSGWKPLTFA
jgi:branched-chain amino acid transport system substrate-binding protein